MISRKSLPVLSLTLSLIAIAGVVGVYSQNQPAVVPQDFDPGDSRDWPVLTDIHFDIKGIANIGEIYMLEGLDNETAIQVERNSFTAGSTSYAPLVLHGIFSRLIRDWRDDVISGTFTKHDIQMDIYNSRGQRVLRVNFINAWPTRFTLPPFSVDNKTRYMERMELIYDRYEIID